MEIDVGFLRCKKGRLYFLLLMLVTWNNDGALVLNKQIHPV